MTTSTAPVVVRNAGIMGGRPIFRGTRVQIEMLFENLAEGYSLDEIVENFPTLDKDDLRDVLLQACNLIKAAAPEVTPDREPEPRQHARLFR